MERIKEALLSPEPEKEYQSRIELDFFRHSIKENIFSDDSVNPLSPAGRHFIKKQAEPGKIRQSLAFGSPRERAPHSALLKMAGAEAEITGDESFEELKAKLNATLKIGTKIVIDPELDLSMDYSGPFGAAVAEHWYGDGYLSFITNESDQLAKELGDTTSVYTYSRLSARVAKFIQKHLKVAPVWDRLVKQEKYPSNVLSRFFGSHGGMLEAFLLKIIETLKGKEQRDILIKLLDDENFAPTEGFKIFIDTGPDGGQKIHVFYHKEKDGQVLFHFDEEVSVDLINQLACGETKK
ncbi:MAG: hypothetical protein NTV81_01285 [Candidatus Komeilibacteria bacterium]|nr:hypothetical protein [Candidatus Komeilibacteria bacterium]